MNLSVAQRWQVAAIILVGLNLRPVLASVPPLLDALQVATGMTDGAAGLMTALPVFVMGIGALSAALAAPPAGRAPGRAAGAGRDRHRRRRPAGGGSYRRVVGHRRRGRPGHRHRAGPAAGLHQGTPRGCQQRRDGALFDRHHGRRGHRQRRHAADGAPTVAVPVAGGLGLARPGRAGCWARAAGRAEAVAHAAGADGAHGRRAWLLAIFFGLGTGAYTLVLAWLPPYYTALGWTPVAAGSLLGAVTVAEIAAGLLVSALIGRLPDRRPALYLAIGSLLVGLAGLAIAPLALPGRPPCWRAWASAPSSVVADRDHGSRGHARGRPAGGLRAGRGVSDRGDVSLCGRADPAACVGPAPGMGSDDGDLRDPVRDGLRFRPQAGRR